MAGMYRIEAKSAYQGLREYSPGTIISPAAVYIESLMPGTDLTPYRMREIRSPRLSIGFVIDGSLELKDSVVYFRPAVIDPNRIAKIIAQTAANNAGPTLTNPEDFDKLVITHGYSRREGGLKLLIVSGDHEHVCRLIPPPDSITHSTRKLCAI